MTESEREAFTRCWQQNVDRLHAYAVRHVGRDDAPEIVSEAFLQAWRRWSDVPDPALPWLIGTARRLSANQRRGHRRRDALADRVALLEGAAATAEAAEVVATQRQAAIRALADLAPADREALLLLAWDGLSVEQAAAVVGVRAGTLRVRLHRARARLSAAHDAQTRIDGPEALTVTDADADTDTEEIPCPSS